MNQLSIFQETNQDEIWVPTYLSKDYLVSNQARVYSNKTCKFLKPYIVSDKYCNRMGIILSVNNSRKNILIHQLVYYSFNQSSPIKGKVIDHIDRNSKNNNLENLRLVTPRQNSNNRSNPSIHGIGVYKDDRKKTPYFVHILINQKNYSFGMYETEAIAQQIYLELTSLVDKGMDIKDIRKIYKKQPKGYYYIKEKKLYIVHLNYKKNQIYVGHYKTEQEAKNAYLLKKQQLQNNGL
jgi:hypothetical protein